LPLNLQTVKKLCYFSSHLIVLIDLSLDMAFFKALNNTTYKVSAGATKLDDSTR
jgi:hypothetical protein